MHTGMRIYPVLEKMTRFVNKAGLVFKEMLPVLLRLLPKTLLFTYFGFFFLTKINLPIVDLGRHLVNGKLFVEQGSVLRTNLYSYTNADFPVVTHHWGVGVIFYLIYRVSGFEGLTFLNAVLASLTALFIYLSVRKRCFFGVFALSLLLLAPLFASRNEVRPENFSYLLLAMYVYIFESYGVGQFKLKLLLPFLFLLQVLWVNFHIFFVFGIIITAIYVFYFILVKKVGTQRWEVLVLLLSIVLASLVNPFGLEGLLTPFNIFRNYGYRISENQSVFFMQIRYPKFEYFFFEIAGLFLLGCITYLLYKKKAKDELPGIVISLIFLVLGGKYLRAIPLFVITAIPVMTLVLGEIKKKVFIYGALFVVIGLSLIPGTYFSPFQPGFGVGLGKDSMESLEFFNRNSLKGPVFNNYDIGSYLIYGLYPREKVFVDNRPEAYPEDFFTETYVPMQENEEKWKEVMARHNFNVIFFYRRDFTPWAQPFLITRLADHEWVPVYVDDFALILVRNGVLNKELIVCVKILLLCSRSSTDRTCSS
ncbi:MAG: hypothetical protein UU91_C0007G0013 [candidate division WWE3 bacterium GW2011_GWB1_42_117]|nr:MAG: hypothetical protein UU91_C0007G0013 [candidate division WWE3 bacterium GW2011_GWB1_42_117]